MQLEITQHPTYRIHSIWDKRKKTQLTCRAADGNMQWALEEDRSYYIVYLATNAGNESCRVDVITVKYKDGASIEPMVLNDPPYWLGMELIDAGLSLENYNAKSNTLPDIDIDDDPRIEVSVSATKGSRRPPKSLVDNDNIGDDHEHGN